MEISNDKWQMATLCTDAAGCNVNRWITEHMFCGQYIMSFEICQVRAEFSRVLWGKLSTDYKERIERIRWLRANHGCAEPHLGGAGQATDAMEIAEKAASPWRTKSPSWLPRRS